MLILEASQSQLEGGLLCETRLFLSVPHLSFLSPYEEKEDLMALPWKRAIAAAAGNLSTE